MGLETYRKKRNFKKTPEPEGKIIRRNSHSFTIQKHAASHLHYDFRLELDGVLKSWAVPKGPCLDPNVKRLAIQVEDHPVEYGTFEGIIPQGQYGGGTVLLWDYGEWHSLEEDPMISLHRGHLRFELKGKKLKGEWHLIHFKAKEWFLIKKTDRFAKSLGDYDITQKKPLSVLTKRTMDEIRDQSQNSAVWYSNRSKTDLNLKNTTIKSSSFPNSVQLELATLVDKPPSGDEWLHEVKFDGYRIVAFKKENKVNLFSRNQKEWTEYFPNIVAAIQKLPGDLILDGEVVVLDEENRSDFQQLQNAMHDKKVASFIYYVFDLLYWQKFDLRVLPLIERKAYLSELIGQDNSIIRYSDHVINHGDEVFKQSCNFALEGIISKALQSPYRGKRTTDWLKVKCIQRQEFVVGGFSKPNRSRKFFGSLYLGYFNENGELIFCGNVGTGFTESSLKEIYDLFQPLITNKNPFTTVPPEAKKATWVNPSIVVEVEFTEWTKEKRLRHPSFKGVRLDKKTKEVYREKVQKNKQEANISSGNFEEVSRASMVTSDSAASIISVKSPDILTHPQKILYPEDQITKQQIYDYYEAVAGYILPFIKNRPLTLVRCPDTYQSCFFQKHLQKNNLPGILPAPVEEKNKTIKQYIYIEKVEGIFSLIQMGALEIHPWSSTLKDLNQPDLLIFDLDPGPNVSWKQVVKAALDIKILFDELNLKVFVRTTGGKGLHLVVPIRPEHSWETIKTYTQLFALSLEQHDPKRFVSKMTKSVRAGKIFIDYLRNQKGATAIASYSTRARVHAPVATPIHWDELTHRFEDTAFTIKTLPQRLDKLKIDPWQDFWSTHQHLNLEE